MKWIIDTDPGVDDAAAIMTAVKHGIDVIGLTTVCGNTPLVNSTRNALRLVEMLGVDIPVYVGAERPLLEPPHHAAEVHGGDGFGDAGLPEPTRRPAPGYAADFICASADRYAGQLSILAIGPLTNLALAIAKDRSLVKKIDRIVLMGGTSEAKGNTSLVGEFNVWADPEAAAIVFGAGIPITMVPWETTLQAIITTDDLDRLAGSGKPLAQNLAAMSAPMTELMHQQMGIKGCVLCDLVAAAIIIDPSLCTGKVQTHVAVETAGTISRGLTAVDYAHISGQPANVQLVLNVDGRKIADLLVRTLTA